MATRDILQEAIADAKAVREAALTNAKLALEETFAPTLQRMISAKIQEEIEESSDDNKETCEEVNLESIIAELENDVTVSEEAEVEDENTVETIDQVDETHVEDEVETTDEELNLDELLDSLKEVEEVTEVITVNEDDDEVIDVEDDEVNPETEATPGEEVVDVEDEEEVVAPEVDEEGNETTEDWRTGYVLGYKACKALDTEEDKEEGEKEDDLDITIDDDNIETTPEVDNTELDALKNEMSELKSTLTEVTMLNSKLLYANKLFRALNLTEAQKATVIEKLDSGKTVKEVKEQFNMLAEGLKKEVTTTKRTITESIASRSTASTKPNNDIVQSDPIADRFRHLANLGKKK